MAGVSIIIVSHAKPELVKEAVQSVLDQTHRDWQAILVDSGVLYNKGYFEFIRDSRFEILPSGETPDMANSMNMASWCFNQVLNSGRVKGELILYLCDDDLIYPDAFETFWSYYVEHRKEPQAMYASQAVGLVLPDGKTQIIGRRRARRPAGRFCRGAKLDCRVDYLQFCHTARILEDLKRVHGSDRFHSESKADAAHADGIFMERIGALTTVHPIDKVISLNRRTAGSANLAYSTSRVGRLGHLLLAKLKGLRQRLASRRAAQL